MELIPEWEVSERLILPKDIKFYYHEEDYQELINTLNLARIPYSFVIADDHWVRDFYPFMARSEDKDVFVLDFNYFTPDMNNELVSYHTAVELDLPRVSVPISLRAGNLQCGKKYCFTTEQTVELEKDQGSYDGGSVFDGKIIKEYLRRATGREIHILKNLPYEGTGHIDMWLKFINDNTVIVGKLDKKTVAWANYSSISFNIKAITEVKVFLDNQILYLKKIGLTVLTLPFPLPLIHKNNNHGLFRSYVNFILFNNKAIVPRYRKHARNQSGIEYNMEAEYIDIKLLKKMEVEVGKTLRKPGLSIHWVSSDAYIKDGGSLHCLTGQLPRF